MPRSTALSDSPGGAAPSRTLTAVQFLAADDRRVVQVGGDFEPMFGYTSAGILGQPWDVLHALDDRDALDALGSISRHLDAHGAWVGEIHSRRRDGSVFWSITSIARCDHATHGRVWVVVQSDRTAPKLAEAALRRSEERLLLAAGVAEVGVWEWDVASNSIFWDDRMYDMFDIPRGPAFRYEDWIARLHPDDSRRAQELLQQLFAGEARLTCEYRIIHRDGTVRHVQAEGKSWADGTGRVTRLVGVNIDVTARKQVEATLRDSEEKFARAFHRAPVFMSISTLDTGTYLDVNEHARVLTGFTREEMIGQTSVGIGLISPEDRNRMAALIAAHGRIDGFDLPFVRKDGRPGLCRVHAESLTIAERPCLLLIAIDVTEARKAEEQIRQLSQAVEQSPSAVIITDPQGRIEYVNPKFTQVTGYTLDEIRGQNPRILKSGEMSPQAYQKLWQTITAGGTWRGVFHNRSKSGESYWEDATLSPIRAPDGRITHFLAVKEDLTARKLLEDRYRQSQKMEAVGQLAGGLAHDYNNILTATLMQLSLLQDDPELTPSVRTALQELEKLAARSARLTRQLLTFSRQQPIEVAPLDMTELLNNLLGMLRHLLGEHIKLNYLRPDASLWTVADTGMIEQLVTNLAVNARDAMAPHGGTLIIHPEQIVLDAGTASRNPDAYPGTFVCLSVIDTGCGMSAATQKRIFEPFFTTKDVGKGTGLGLATVFGIVQQHRGWIEVESVVDRGSTFRVYLPALSAPPDVATTEQARVMTRGTETVLVVEDEPMVRNMTVAGLQSCGYRVWSAEDGRAALALCETQGTAFDVLVSDMVMPQGVSGVDLAIKLRERKPDMKVIICTGYSRVLSGTGLKEVPGAIHLAKPFELPKLAATIRHLLDQP